MEKDIFDTLGEADTVKDIKDKYDGNVFVEKKRGTYPQTSWRYHTLFLW